MASQRRTVVKTFKDSPVGSYFDPAQKLVEENYPYDVAIAYMFARLERAQRDALAYGAIKLHHLDGKMTSDAISRLDITRSSFHEHFKTVFGKALGKKLQDKIKHAETVRDTILHGKLPSQADKRQAICDILEYFEGFRNRIQEIAKFDLAGDMRGFTGAKAKLDRKITGWMLKGMGLSHS